MQLLNNKKYAKKKRHFLSLLSDFRAAFDMGLKVLQINVMASYYQSDCESAFMILLPARKR